MKKILRPKNLPLLVLAASVLGLLLRLWTVAGGPDASGLYERRPFVWVLIWIVTALTLGITAVVSARLKNPGKYTDNFPASIPGAIGTAAAALCIMISSALSLMELQGFLDVILCILGLLGGLALVLTAIDRLMGRRPSFLLHALVCLYFALRTFRHCQIWSNEPQLGIFIFPFLASLSVMLAAYQRTCFDVDLGKRRHSLFWSMTAVFFCVLAIPKSGEPLFYICMALWLMTNLCSLRPLNKRKAAPDAPKAAQPVEIPPEAPVQTPAQEPATETPTIDPVTPTLSEDMSYEDLKQWLDQQ